MIRVLVVEDDIEAADLHSMLTEKVGGFEVVGKAHRGQDALRMVEQLEPDLLLMDIRLPDISGLDLIRRLRTMPHPVDVIAITAADDLESLRQAMQGGVLHYLIKPFLVASFVDKLQSYAAMRTRLGRAGRATQEEVDQIYGLLRPVTSKVLPKGLAVETLDLVIAALREVPTDLPAAEVAVRIGVSRITARRYLEYLSGLGQVDVRMRYGSPGRPERRYRMVS